MALSSWPRCGELRPCHKGTLRLGAPQAPAFSDLLVTTHPRVPPGVPEPRHRASSAPYVPWVTLPRRRAPVKPICGAITAPRRNRHIGQPEARLQEPGLSPAEEQARGAGLGASQYGNVDQAPRPSPTRVHSPANRSRATGDRARARRGTWGRLQRLGQARELGGDQSGGVHLPPCARCCWWRLASSG
jgi:hypothetical protein